MTTCSGHQDRGWQIGAGPWCGPAHHLHLLLPHGFQCMSVHAFICLVAIESNHFVAHQANGCSCWSALGDNAVVPVHAWLSFEACVHCVCWNGLQLFDDSCLEAKQALCSTLHSKHTCFAAYDMYQPAGEGKSACLSSFHRKQPSAQTGCCWRRNCVKSCFAVQVDLTKVWLTMSSIIVAFSFSFSNSIMNLFNSVILLFVVHPFDVGDALLITTTTTGSGAADYCVVEELSLVVHPSALKHWTCSGNCLPEAVAVLCTSACIS